MKDIGFGLAMTLAGMTVTLITLYLLTLLIQLLNRLFPFEKEKQPEKADKAEIKTGSAGIART